jgi:hypothetical protein
VQLRQDQLTVFGFAAHGGAVLAVKRDIKDTRAISLHELSL